MQRKRATSTSTSRTRAKAHLSDARNFARSRWQPQRPHGSGLVRGVVRSGLFRVLSPYERHRQEVLDSVVSSIRGAVLSVADDVDALRRKADMPPAKPDPDTFVVPTMSKLELELHSKRSRFYAYLGDHLGVCRVLGNMKMFVDTRDHVLAPHLMTDGYWESWITLAMLRTLKPGMVAVDVGANYGYFTILMGRAVGNTGRVIAYEPNPHMAELMRKSLWISGIRRIDEVRGEAAFSTTGESVRFFIPDIRPMNARVVDEPLDGGRTIEVPTVRLDDALPEKVDFIKIDAEGAEREIWRGMEKTLAANPQLQIFLEFNPRRTQFYDPAEFLERITADGFKLAVVAYDASYKPVDAERLITTGSEVILHLRR